MALSLAGSFSNSPENDCSRRHDMYCERLITTAWFLHEHVKSTLQRTPDPSCYFIVVFAVWVEAK